MYYDAKGNAMLGFDTAGVYSGAPAVVVAGPPGAPAKGVPEEVQAKTAYQALVNSIRRLDAEDAKIETRIDEVKQKIQTAPPEETEKLQVELGDLKQQNSNVTAQKNYKTAVGITEVGAIDTTVTGAPATSNASVPEPMGAPSQSSESK